MTSDRYWLTMFICGIISSIAALAFNMYHTSMIEYTSLFEYREKQGIITTHSLFIIIIPLVILAKVLKVEKESNWWMRINGNVQQKRQTVVSKP